MNRYAPLWRLLHRALLLQAGVGSSKPDKDGGHRKQESRAPNASATLDVRLLEKRWAACNSDSDRREVLRDAWRLYRADTVPKGDPRKLRGTKEWREVIANDERPASAVAKMYGVSQRTVFNYRAKYRRSHIQA